MNVLLSMPRGRHKAPGAALRPGLLTVILAALSLLWAFLPGRLFAAEALVLGVHPYLSATELHQRFRPLADYLGAQTGAKITLRIAKDYQEHIIDVGTGCVDIAYLGPASYVKLVERYGPQRLLGRFETDGKPVFYGVLFTRAGSPVRSLKDLRGKRIAFGDRNSTMSHLVPLHMLKQAGVGLKDLAAHEFLNKHENVALGVLSGDFDAGAVKEETFQNYEQRGLKLLAKTPPISEHVMTAAGRVPEKTVAALRRALFRLKDTAEGRALLNGVKEHTTGFSPAADADYDGLRRILRELDAMGVQ